MFKFSDRSEQLLNTVHIDLNKLAHEVIKVSKVDFTITSALRTQQEQDKLVARGVSWNKNSLHVKGKAIDICPVINGQLDFEAESDLFYLVGLFDCKAKELGIKIRLGAFWDNPSIKQNRRTDGYHIQLE
jgi:hypothetical protein